MVGERRLAWEAARFGRNQALTWYQSQTPLIPFPPVNRAGRPQSRATDTPRSARKRPHAEEEDEEEHGQDSGRAQKAARQQPAAAAPAAGVAAGAGGSGRGAGGRDAQAGGDAAAAGKGLKAAAPAPAQDGEDGEEGGAGAGAGVGGNKRAGAPKGGRGGNKRRRSTGGVPGERPWQSQDTLAFTPDNHPFHGITRPASLHRKPAGVGVCVSCGAGGWREGFCTT